MGSKKIPIADSQSPLSANPFAGLEMAGLPMGPADSEIGDPKPKAPKPRVVLRREKAHRGGKAVIVVGRIPTHFSPVEIESFARRAKQACGCGGTVSGREIELQGDDPERVRRFFTGEGFQVDGV